MIFTMNMEFFSLKRQDFKKIFSLVLGTRENVKKKPLTREINSMGPFH